MVYSFQVWIVHLNNARFVAMPITLDQAIDRAIKVRIILFYGYL